MQIADEEHVVKSDTMPSSLGIEIATPSDAAVASTAGSSNAHALSILEQARIDRERVIQEGLERERIADRAERRQARKKKKPLWSGRGPKEDAMHGGRLCHGTYVRPCAHMRQCWSDDKRVPGIVGSLVYGCKCVLVAVVAGPGDLAATGLRLCRMPEAGCYWIGRLVSVAFVPATISIGCSVAAVAGPVAGGIIAYRHRDADRTAMQFEANRREGGIRVKHKIYPKSNKDNVTANDTATGTDMTQGHALESYMSAGAVSFEE